MTDLLSRFADPGAIHTMTVADKFLAGLFTTILGMGITLVALVILQFVISWMDRLVNRGKKGPLPSSGPPVQAGLREVRTGGENNEIVAAISVALGLTLGTGSDRIVIRKITQVKDREQPPIWNRMGLMEQLNNRL